MDKKKNFNVIDADSIVYLVASKYKKIKIKSSALNDLDEFIISILTTTYSKDYLGFFGKVGGKRNFRYDIAKTKPYKGSRPEKEPWYIYWEPILKNHMQNVWKFIPVEYVEADDMCTMIATTFKASNKYNRVYISSPDKDLKQLGNTWFYDYRSRKEFFVSESDGKKNLYYQMVEGDSTDNIQGILGVGEVKAKEFIKSINNIKNIEKETFAFYLKQYQEEIPKRAAKKAEKVYLSNYKITQGLKRFTKKTKAEALMYFSCLAKPAVIFDSMVKELYDENYALLYMLRTEEEVKVYWKDFKLPEAITDTYIDWDEVDVYKEQMDADIVEEDFEDDIYDEIDLEDDTI